MAKVSIRLADTDAEYIYVNDLMYSEPGIREIFFGKQTRAMFSYHLFIIEIDGKDAGFIYTADEKLEYFGFVDMGLKKQYRGKGYGTRAMLELVKFYLENYPEYKMYLIGETKVYNDAANHSANNVGSFLFKYEDRNFYLINDHMMDDLLETGNIELLKQHVDDCSNHRKRI